MDAVTEQTVRISSTQRSPSGSGISLTGLTAQEAERAEGMVFGQWWMRGNNGRLEFHPSREAPPAPTDDDMLPEWRKPRDGAEKAQVQMELLDTERTWDNQSPSIIIQHLCGYNYSADGYRWNACRLESYGFACLRSRRRDDGRFHESWLLPGLWAAEGDLKEAIRPLPKDEQMKAALKFLASHTSFGTLDVAVQRMAQVLD